jgi:enterochelin esterase-like enzyme
VLLKTNAHFITIRARFLFLFCVFTLVTKAQDFPLPFVKNGTIERMHFRHTYFDRQVDVWLPDGFAAHKKTDVLIMHDGQMLFDSTITWNQQEWGVDECLTKLKQEGLLTRQVLVIGIHNDPYNRYQEFFPNSAYDFLPDSLQKRFESELWGGLPSADQYLANVMELIVPMVEDKFKVSSKRNRHFMIGSSMGAIVSYYALGKHPKELDGVAGLSIHLPMINASKYDSTVQSKSFEALLAYASSPKERRIYRKKIWIDRGTVGLDALYRPYFDFFCHGIAQSIPRNNLFIYKTYEGAGHSERDWNARLAEVVCWLLNEKGR